MRSRVSRGFGIFLVGRAETVQPHLFAWAFAHASQELIPPTCKTQAEMSVIGQVESLWSYPVKSMCGQALGEVFVGFSGVYGDRLFAFKTRKDLSGRVALSPQISLAAAARFHSVC